MRIHRLPLMMPSFLVGRRGQGGSESVAAPADARPVLSAESSGTLGGIQATGKSAKCDQVCRLGNFTVSWHAAERYLTVLDRETHKIVWETLPGAAFIHASMDQARVPSRSGYFPIVHQPEKKTYCHQQLNAFEPLGDELSISGKVFKDDGHQSVPFTLTFQVVDCHRLAFKLEVVAANQEFNFVELVSSSPEEEVILGFGLQFDHFNHKGKRIPIICQEKGLGRGHPTIDRLANSYSRGFAAGKPESSGFVIPQYITNLNRGFFLYNTGYSVFDLRDQKVIAVAAHGTLMEGELLSAESMLGVQSAFGRYVGPIKGPPDWSHQGVIVGLEGGDDEVDACIEKLESSGVKVAAYKFQDYPGKRRIPLNNEMVIWNRWLPCSNRYARWNERRERLAEKGIRVVGYWNSYVSPLRAVEKLLLSSPDEDLYSEAEQKGYLVHNHQGKMHWVHYPSFQTPMIDVYRPEARQWTINIIRQRLFENAGFSGFMADFLESYPVPDRLGHDVDDVRKHNDYPAEVAKTIYEAIYGTEEERKNGFKPYEDIFTFYRVGNIRSFPYINSVWTADHSTTYDAYNGYKACLIGLMSPLPFVHADAGLYLSFKLFGIGFDREKGLLLNTFMTFAFLLHLRSHLGLRRLANWQVYSDKETLHTVAKFSKIFAQLFPYRLEVIGEAEEKFWPVIRNPIFYYQDDKELYKKQYQLMLGSEIMVAPVVEKGEQSRKVYLPKDKWINIWDPTVIIDSPGEYYIVPAPNERPAVFMRPGKHWEQFQPELKKINEEFDHVIEESRKKTHEQMLAELSFHQFPGWSSD